MREPTKEELDRIEAESSSTHDVDVMIAAASREEHPNDVDKALEEILDVYTDVMYDINHGVGDEETLKQNLCEYITEKARELRISFDNMFNMFVKRYAL